MDREKSKIVVSLCDAEFVDQTMKNSPFPNTVLLGLALEHSRGHAIRISDQTAHIKKD